MQVRLRGLLLHLQNLPNPADYNEMLPPLHPINKKFFNPIEFYLDGIMINDFGQIIPSGEMRKITAEFSPIYKNWIIKI